MKIIKLNQVSSTNDYLKENYLSLENYQVVTASFQTNGRGRLNRNWQSNKSENIMMSILIKDLKKRFNFQTITLFTGCVVHHFLSKYLTNIWVKWPNDILVDNKKIAGILTEGITIGNKVSMLVIGIGININQQEFNEDIKDISTSLKQQTHQEYNLDELIYELTILLKEELDKYLNNDDSYLKYLQNYLYAKGEQISFYKHNQIHQGTLIDIDQMGRLMVLENNNMLYLESGEIKIIRKHD